LRPKTRSSHRPVSYSYRQVNK